MDVREWLQFFNNMKKEIPVWQQSKIMAAKVFISNYKADDILYHTVAIIGPSVFGSLIKANSDTVWSRVENPGSFRMIEMLALSDIFEITMMRLIEIIQLQMQHNEFELSNNRPLGKEKYQSSNL